MKIALYLLETLVKGVIAVPLFMILLGTIALKTGNREMIQSLGVDQADDIALFVCGTIGGFGIVCLWASILARPWLGRVRRIVLGGLWTYTVATGFVLGVLAYRKATGGRIAPEGLVILAVWLALGAWELFRWRRRGQPNQSALPTPV